VPGAGFWIDLVVTGAFFFSGLFMLMFLVIVMVSFSWQAIGREEGGKKGKKKSDQYLPL